MIDLAAKPAVTGLPKTHGRCTLSAILAHPPQQIIFYPGAELRCTNNVELLCEHQKMRLTVQRLPRIVRITWRPWDSR